MDDVTHLVLSLLLALEQQQPHSPARKNIKTLSILVMTSSLPMWGGFDGFDITKPDPLQTGISEQQVTLQAMLTIPTSEQLILLLMLSL